MAKSNYRHNNFSAGQYDREFTGQDQNAIHQNGLSHCLNVLSSVQGELKSRPGTQWKADLNDEAVIIPFRRGEKDLALVFQDSTLDVYENNGDLLVPFRSGVVSTVVWNNTSNLEPSTNPVSVTGDVSGNIDNFYQCFTENTGVMLSNYLNRRLFIPAVKYPTVYFGMEFSAGKALQKVEMELLPADGNFNQKNFTATKTWVKYVVLQYSDNNLSWTTVRLAKPWAFVGRRQDTPNGTRVANVISLQPLSTASHRYWRVTVIFDRSVMMNNAPICVNFNGNVFEETISEHQTLNTVYTRESLKKLKYAQQYNEMIICDGINTPYKFTMTGNVPNLDTPDYNFIETDGIPSCVRYWGNRLWFGGFVSFPTRVRGSQFGNYTNFNVNTTNVVETDPISIDGAELTERITDLWGGFNVLYAQSADGISFITSSSATNAAFRLQCYEKASGITPTMKDNIMFYVGIDKKKIHAFAYDKLIEQFVAPDVSRYAQEALKDNISEIHFVNSRNRNIIGVLENGKMFGMLYDQNTLTGYFPLDVGASVYDISVLKNGNNTELYITAQRNGQWVIEQFHLPAFMQRTNGFTQTTWERNVATQKNLFDTPHIDGWKSLTNEALELWEYDQTTGQVKPADNNLAPTPLSPFLGKIVRFYYGDGIRDYASVKIEEAFTQTQTYDREQTITRNIQYYGWTYATSINVSAIAGYTPAWNGTFTRNTSLDGTSGKTSYTYAWTQGSYTGFTTTPNPSVGASLYAIGGHGAYAKATITASNTGTVLTQTSSPTSGTDVYNEQYAKIGNTTAGSSSSITYGNTVYLRNTKEDALHPESFTEIVQETVEIGYYDVTIIEPDKQQDYLFTKMQLPIETIGSADNPITSDIQIQDNGIYYGDFTPTNGIITLTQPMYNIQWGYMYEKIAIITEFASKDRLKQWGTVTFALIDTMDLMVGSKLKAMEQLIEFKPSLDYYNSNPIMFNGVIAKNIADTDDYEKNLIIQSKKGLPFCIVGLEASMLISDTGGN